MQKVKIIGGDKMINENKKSKNAPTFLDFKARFLTTNILANMYRIYYKIRRSF